jgi:ribosome-associated protein
LEKNAEDVVLMDLRKLGAMTDFFVICTGGVEQHVKAIADNITRGMRKQGVKTYHQEGFENWRWILLDYFDVVVHVFQPAWRDYYHLEDLWGDARTRVLDDAYLKRKAARAKKKSKAPKKKAASRTKSKTQRTKSRTTRKV